MASTSSIIYGCHDPLTFTQSEALALHSARSEEHIIPVLERVEGWQQLVYWMLKRV